MEKEFSKSGGRDRICFVKSMNTIISTMNDESAYLSWIHLVPDQATEDDFRDIAESEELFTMTTELFLELLLKYGKSGFYSESLGKCIKLAKADRWG